MPTAPMTIERIRLWLGWPEDAVPRLEIVDAFGPPPGGFEMPARQEALDLLRRLEVPPQGHKQFLDRMPTPDSDPDAWWLLERLFHAIVRESDTGGPPWPAPELTDDPLTQFFHLYAFLPAIPPLLRKHGARGIPEAVTWQTLFDVGLQAANFEVRTGRPGFDGAFWVWPHFRSTSFTIGRLQFEPIFLPEELKDADRYREGDPALGVHIPALGPLTPESCDESLLGARAFFEAHFPEHHFRTGVCDSWLMDPQLHDHLPETSNILAFQDRFTITSEWSRPSDDDVVRFVFGRLPADLDALPLVTTVERAVVGHLKAGGHWFFRRGWLEL